MRQEETMIFRTFFSMRNVVTGTVYVRATRIEPYPGLIAATADRVTDRLGSFNP
ncbi:hypothetical protein GCM10023092_08190 [Rurimicrobium arvi]|uniref:Uncharacterized protein n=1 Tax=Rurimicrobium arvi TaxID=2049916 RepID=A0ABP8MLS3_9BACT